MTQLDAPQTKDPLHNWAGLALMGVLIVATLIILFVPGNPTEKLSLAIGYGLLILFFGFGMIIFLAMASGKIDLSMLLSEPGGGASMSRFQLLIFTFVIALSVFLIVAKNGQLPAIPTEVLTLLGISATTYGVSKGIQVSSGSPGKTDTPRKQDDNKPSS